MGYRYIYESRWLPAPQYRPIHHSSSSCSRPNVVTSIHPSPPNVPPNVQSSLRGLLRCWNTCLSAPVVEGDGAPRPAETCSNNAQPSATVRQIYNNHIGPNYAGVSEQGGPGGGASPHVRGGGGGAEYHFPPPPKKKKI